MRKRVLICSPEMNGGDANGSSDDVMGKSSSLAAAASGLPNGNRQRHHQRQEERGENVPLGKGVFPYITLHTSVNENLGGFQARGRNLLKERRKSLRGAREKRSTAVMKSC